MKEKTFQTAIRLPISLKSTLQKEADKTGDSLAGVLVKRLREWQVLHDHGYRVETAHHVYQNNKDTT